MTRRSGDHWETGDPDLGRRAKDLSVAGVDAEVVLVQFQRDPEGSSDPEEDDRVLATLWQAGTGMATGGVDGRRLSWRSFVLVVHGDSRAVREAIVRASEHIRGTRVAEAWHVSVHWIGSSGDFIEDVKRLETEASLDPT